MRQYVANCFTLSNPIKPDDTVHFTVYVCECVCVYVCVYFEILTPPEPRKDDGEQAYPISLNFPKHSTSAPRVRPKSLGTSISGDQFRNRTLPPV